MKRLNEKRHDVPRYGECGGMSETRSKINRARCSANDGEIIDDPMETSFQFSLRQLQEFPQVLNYSLFSLNVHLFQIRVISIIEDNQISIVNAVRFHLLLHLKFRKLIRNNVHTRCRRRKQIKKNLRRRDFKKSWALKTKENLTSFMQ